MEAINEEVKTMVDALGEEERRWFYELSEGEEGEEEGLGREMRIVKTNGVDLGGGGEGSSRVGVFRWFSRLV